MKNYTRDELELINIHELRAMLRDDYKGAPGQKSKATIIDEILSAQEGKEIAERTNRGRKPLNLNEIAVNEDGVTQPQNLQSSKCCGVLDICVDGYGFLRADNCDTSKSDVFLSKNFIRQNGLRQGDLVEGICERLRENESPALQTITKLNSIDYTGYRKRPFFDDLTPCYPDQKIVMELLSNPTDLSIRCIDLLCPIGKGQRGLIVAPPKTGKTTILKKVAKSIEENHKEITLMVLLVDERPEEVTDIKESVNGEVIYSTFDEAPEHHIKIAELVLSRAKRLVEEGKDVVILLDSITKLARAYNVAMPSSGKTLSGGVDPLALVSPKKFLGSARNIRNGGSLTILATALVETGSRMDEVIFEEFKGTGNMEIILTSRLSERRIFPAIDLFRSGTRKEELLLSSEELDCAFKVRRLLQEDLRASESFLSMLAKTKTNAEFASKLDEWLKISNLD